MSRSGYNEDCDDQWSIIRWRGAVRSATRGKRGQAFFRELLAALDTMPAKRLISNDLVREDSTGFENVCALGALGKARGVNMGRLDPDDPETVAGTFNIADALAREVVFENDEAVYWKNETPEERWVRVRSWVASQIVSPPAPADEAGGRS